MDHSVLKVKVELAYPVGFQLHLTTWENDGDFYSDQVISGLTEADVSFYVDVAMLFTSKNNRKNGDGMGNTENDPSYLLEVIQEKLEKHPNISEKTKKIWSTADEETIHELLVEHILGETTDYEDYDNFCRVFESFKVLEIREPVIDVTKQFK